MSSVESSTPPPALDLSAPETLQQYLVASLSESGAHFDDTTRRFRQACRWYAALLGQGFDRVPFFLVFDLGHLLLLGRRFPFRSLHEHTHGDQPPRDTPARRRRIRYENRLLNGFLNLPVFITLRDILEDARDLDARVLAMLGCWLTPLKSAPLPTIQAAANAIRQIGGPGNRTPDEQRHAWLTQHLHDTFTDQLERTLQAYAQVALGALIGPEDLFVFRHIEALGQHARRLVARQLADMEARMGNVDPPPAHLRREAPQVTVDLDDAGFFPQGGLDQLANRGSIENLVRTELAYLEDDADIDLFTLRHVEGELLYYTRDEGQLMRRSRTLRIVMTLSGLHHILYPGHPARLAILLQAMVNRLVDDLLELFEGDALQILLEAQGMHADEVSELWQIRFKDAIERGEVRVSQRLTPLDLGDADTLATLIQAGRLNSLIQISDASLVDANQHRQLEQDGLHVQEVICPGERPSSEEGDTMPVLPNPDAPVVHPVQPWALHQPLDSHMLRSLTAIRRALIWGLFGCA